MLSAIAGNVIFEKISDTSIAAQVLREQALVYGLWVTQPNQQQAYLIIHVAKAKHAEFKRLMEAGEVFDLAQCGELLYTGWDDPDDDQKAVFREKYGLFE
jgi:hypothetical protein